MSSSEFAYTMLDRLKQDCEYYLGAGNRAEKHLHTGAVATQIAQMRELWNGLSDKPEWLSLEDIDRYEVAMTEQEKGKSMPQQNMQDAAELTPQQLAEEARGEAAAAASGAAESEAEHGSKGKWKFITVDKAWIRPHTSDDAYTLRLNNFTAKLDGETRMDGWELYVKGRQLSPDKFRKSKCGINFPVDKLITLKRYPIDPETGLHNYGAKPDVIQVSHQSLERLCKDENVVVDKRRDKAKKERGKESKTPSQKQSQEQGLSEDEQSKSKTMAH